MNRIWAQLLTLSLLALTISLAQAEPGLAANGESCQWGRLANESPADGATGLSSHPSLAFSYRPAFGGQNALLACLFTRAEWQVATDSAFTQNVRTFQTGPGHDSDAGCDCLYFRNSVVATSPGTLYYWRARLMDDDGHVSDWTLKTRFTTELAAPLPPPATPPASSRTLQTLDANGDCLVEDVEFFVALDDWIAELITDTLFFQVVDIWIGQVNLCASAASADILEVNLLQSHSNLVVTAADTEVESLAIQIFDSAGNLISSSRAFGSSVRISMTALAGQRLANGIYLYRIQATLRNGSQTITGLHKLFLLR